MCHCGRCFFNFDDDGYGGYGYGSDYSSDYGGEEDYYDMMMEHYLGVFGGRKAGKGNAREKSDAALLREHTARDRFKELADATPANCSGTFPPLCLSVSADRFRTSPRSATHKMRFLDLETRAQLPALPKPRTRIPPPHPSRWDGLQDKLLN